MRVVVDARQIFRPERRGIGKTLLQLYRTLSRVRPHWQFRLVHQRAFAVPELADCPNLQPVRVDCVGSHRFDFWENVLLPSTAWLLRGDVLHSPANTGPAFSRVPLLLHLHDLIPLEVSNSPEEARTWVRQITRATRQAAYILTGSEYSRQRIIEMLKIPSDKLGVQAWAADPKMRPLPDRSRLDDLLPQYGLARGEPYLFAFGANDPRKNTRLIVDAYCGLPRSVQAHGRLLIVGLQEPALSSFRQLVRDRDQSRQMLLHGFAPEVDLPDLLAGALGLVYASSYEGFGLPVLDAFACGTPVLAGNKTSVPEVAGDAAGLFDPDSQSELQANLNRLLTDLDWRAELRERGLARTQQYSWEATAEVVAIALENCRRRGPKR